MLREALACAADAQETAKMLREALACAEDALGSAPTDAAVSARAVHRQSFEPAAALADEDGAVYEDGHSRPVEVDRAQKCARKRAAVAEADTTAEDAGASAATEAAAATETAVATSAPLAHDADYFRELGIESLLPALLHEGAAVAREGWLFKKGAGTSALFGRRSWKRRYCVLLASPPGASAAPSALFWFQAPPSLGDGGASAATPLGVVMLDSTDCVAAAARTPDGAAELGPDAMERHRLIVSTPAATTAGAAGARGAAVNAQRVFAAADACSRDAWAAALNAAALSAAAPRPPTTPSP